MRRDHGALRRSSGSREDRTFLGCAKDRKRDGTRAGFRSGSGLVPSRFAPASGFTRPISTLSDTSLSRSLDRISGVAEVAASSSGAGASAASIPPESRARPTISRPLDHFRPVAGSSIAAKVSHCQVRYCSSSACPGEVESGSPGRTVVRRQGHASTLESTAFSVHVGSPSDQT